MAASVILEGKQRFDLSCCLLQAAELQSQLQRQVDNYTHGNPKGENTLISCTFPLKICVLRPGLPPTNLIFTLSKMEHPCSNLQCHRRTNCGVLSCTLTIRGNQTNHVGPLKCLPCFHTCPRRPKINVCVYSRRSAVALTSDFSFLWVNKRTNEGVLVSEGPCSKEKELLFWETRLPSPKISGRVKLLTH